jgi:hypothetical protein
MSVLCCNIVVQLASSSINCSFYVALRKEVKGHLMLGPIKLGCFFPSNNSVSFKAVQMNILKKDMHPLAGKLLLVVKKFRVMTISLKERHFK